MTERYTPQLQNHTVTKQLCRPRVMVVNYSQDHRLRKRFGNQGKQTQKQTICFSLASSTPKATKASLRQFYLGS